VSPGRRWRKGDGTHGHKMPTPIRGGHTHTNPERSGEEAPLATSKKPMNSVGNWCCKSCNTTDESLRYKSGMMANCYTCQAYDNACKNSAQKKHKRARKGHVVRFTREEFHAWARKHPRRCRYCGLNDAQYRALGWVSANGKTLEALGLDRLVDDDYSLENITWCCYICNSTKKSHLTPERMDLVGKLLRSFWLEDLAKSASDTLFAEHAPAPVRRVIDVMPAELPPKRRNRRVTVRRSRLRARPGR